MPNLKLIQTMPTDKEMNAAENISTGALLLKFWPIVAASAIGLLSIGGIYVKVDFIAESIKENKAQFTVVNDRQNLTSASLIELRGQVANLADANSRNAQAIADLNGKVDRISDKTRWTPK